MDERSRIVSEPHVQRVMALGADVVDADGAPAVGLLAAI
jgi:hypothetical protein